MSCARWLGVAVSAIAVAACGEDVLIDEGAGGAGGAVAATTAPSGPGVVASGATATSVASGPGTGVGPSSVVVGSVVGTGGAGDGGAGGGGEGGVSIDPYVPPEGAYEACEGYWAPMIDLLIDCWGATGEYFYGGEDTVARLADNCARVAFRGGLEVEAQQLCNADIEALATCEELFTYFDRGTDACTATLYGDGEVGEACITGYECSTAACYVLPGGTCGTCVSAGDEGDACNNAGAVCGPYLQCVEGACAYRPQAGDDCSAEETCGGGLACIQGECTTPIAAGEACDLDSETYECAQGTYCNFVTEVCDVMPLGALGEACAVLDDGRLGLCDGGLRCRFDGQFSGTCIEATEDGGSCTPNDPILFRDACESPATCFQGECAMRADALGCL